MGRVRIKGCVQIPGAVSQALTSPAAADSGGLNLGVDEEEVQVLPLELGLQRLQ